MSSTETSSTVPRDVRDAGTTIPSEAVRSPRASGAARAGDHAGTGHGLVTVVLPAYNEVADLPDLVRRLDDVLAGLDRPHRILVVDDGSSDGTADAARAALGRGSLDVISHARNRGLGAALSTGLLHASAESDVVVTMDADNSHDPGLVAEMLERVDGGADVVIASRYREGARTRGVPVHRRFLSWGVRALVGLVAGVPGVRDYSSGYRAYRGETLRRALERYGREGLVEETGFACMLEVLLKIAATGASVTEIPLDLRYDQKQGESKMRVARTIGRYGAVIVRHGEWERTIPDVEAAVRSPEEGPRDRARDVARRVLNVGLAAAALVVTAPLMLVVASAVRISFGRPVLVGATRIGRDRRTEGSEGTGDRRSVDYGGRPFPMYKFRTAAGPDVDSEAQFRTPPDDPSLTGLGRLLRKLRLDELPQLLNVLRGDMNLVGPRPRAPEIALERREGLVSYRLRNQVRPGITGWAQVHPDQFASEDDSRRDLPFDLEYVAERSPVRDLVIVLKTIPVLISGRGAW